MKSKSRSRIPELDGLRAFAILAVFIHHAFGTPLLWAGVDLFFVLSGFLITGILVRRKEEGENYFGYFYARRAKRILAPYTLSLAVATLFFGTLWMKHWYWFAFFATNIGALRQELMVESFSPLWSLGVEEQFYLFWPFVVLFASERALGKIAAFLVVFTPLLRLWYTPYFPTHFAIYYLTPFRMDLLCAGALLSILWKHNPKAFSEWRRCASMTGLVAAAALCVLSRYPWFHVGSNNRLSNSLLPSIVLIVSASALAVALSGEGWLCLILRWPPLRFIGIISYSMYLIHVSALELAARYFPARGLRFLAAFIAATAYSTATWYGFERRLLRR